MELGLAKFRGEMVKLKFHKLTSIHLGSFQLEMSGHFHLNFQLKFLLPHLTRQLSHSARLSSADGAAVGLTRDAWIARVCVGLVRRRRVFVNPLWFWD